MRVKLIVASFYTRLQIVI